MDLGAVLDEASPTSKLLVVVSVKERQCSVPLSHSALLKTCELKSS